MSAKRSVSLFRNGRSQAVRIPKEFELPGSKATIYRDGDRLVIEPASRKTLLELVSEWDPAGDDFPEIADLPPDPVDI